MSCVYSVVIQMYDYEKEKESIQKLNNWALENRHTGGIFRPINGHDSAGTKHPEITLIWGGFNYLNTEDFIEFFKSLKLENSLLTIKYPDCGGYIFVESEDE